MPKHHKKSILPVYLCVFSCIILLLTACSKQPKNSYQGYVEGRYTYIAPQVNGTLRKLHVERGSQVKAGDLLFQLDEQPESYQVEQAKAQLRKAKQNLADLQKGRRKTILLALEAQRQQTIAKLDYAKSMMDRYKKLVGKGFVEKSTYDQSVSDYKNLKKLLAEQTENLNEAKLSARVNQVKAAEEQVSAEEENLKSLEWRLQQKSIHAPIDGFVFDTFNRIGDVVIANQPVLSMLTNDNIKIIFYVPEQALTKIKLGNQVEVLTSEDNKIADATISFISPEAEYTPPVIYSRSRMDKLLFRIEAKPSLNQASLFHPGQPVTVKLLMVQNHANR